MKKSSSRLLQFLILLIFLNISLAEQRARDRDRDPTFSFFRFHVFSNRTQSHGHHRQFEATQLRFSAPIVLSGVLCFIAASISSAGSAYQQEVSVTFFPFYIIFYEVPPGAVVSVQNSLSCNLVWTRSGSDPLCAIWVGSLQTSPSYIRWLGKCQH